MRKSTAVCLIVAGALIVAGLALVTVGLIFSRAIGMDRNMKTNEYEIREAFEDLVIDAATAELDGLIQGGYFRTNETTAGTYLPHISLMNSLR